MRRLFGLAIISALAAILLILAAAPVAHADSRVFPTGYWGPLLSCTGNYNDVVPTGSEGVQEECNDFCDILYTGQNIIDFAITLVVFVGAPVMVAAGGIMYMVGNPLTGEKDSKKSAAKKIIVSAVVGTAIVLGAYIIISTFLWIFGNIGGDTPALEVSWPDIRCEVPPDNPPDDGPQTNGEPPNPTGVCSCSGTVSVRSASLAGQFDQFCPSLTQACSSCGGGRATCNGSFPSTPESCAEINRDPWGVAQRFGLPTAARALISVQGNCTFQPNAN